MLLSLYGKYFSYACYVHVRNERFAYDWIYTVRTDTAVRIRRVNTENTSMVNALP